MSHKLHFPDFEAELPAIPAAWQDVSWRNESCPSFAVSELRICTDRLQPQDREYPECKRFAIYLGLDLLLETDDWDEVLQYVAEYANDVGIDSEADRCRG